MKSINIIGCGKVGRVLGRLWYETNTFKINSVVNRTIENSSSSVRYINSGIPALLSLDEKPPTQAHIHFIAANDDQIAECAKSLFATQVVKPHDIVFHASGALSSEILAPLKESGAYLASVHPVKSFALIDEAYRTFSGTYCGIEGDSEAVDILSDALSKLGAKLFRVNPRKKTYYHAATVISCNYLAAILDFAIKIYQEAGISPQTALEIMEPIVRGTVANVFKLGPNSALSGPIARGDFATVVKQLEGLRSLDSDFGELYFNLGKHTLRLALEKSGNPNAGHDKLAEIFGLT